jgi:putative oxidoreductase
LCSLDSTESFHLQRKGKQNDNQFMPTNWASYLLSVLRIVAALLFFEHGSQKLFGFPPGQPYTGFPNFSLLGIAGMLEVAGGLLLLVGLFTRITAFIVCGEMAVAYFRAHFPRGFFPINTGGEITVLLCFVFLYLVAAGPGPLSLDYALRSRSRISR